MDPSARGSLGHRAKSRDTLLHALQLHLESPHLKQNTKVPVQHTTLIFISTTYMLSNKFTLAAFYFIFLYYEQ